MYLEDLDSTVRKILPRPATARLLAVIKAISKILVMKPMVYKTKRKIKIMK